MTLGFWPMSAWACETLLASLGCFYFFRRRIPILWLWLGFSAIADIVCFLALQLGPRSYLWADYLQRQAQYALIALVSVYTVSQVLREHPRTRRAYLWLLGAMAICSVVIFHAGLPSASAVLKFEIWAEITLSGFVAAAMGTVSGTFYGSEGHDRVMPSGGKVKLPSGHQISQKGGQSVSDDSNQQARSSVSATMGSGKISLEPIFLHRRQGAPKPWGLIACGLVVLGSSDLLVTALRLRGFRAEGIYPVGEILGLGILAWAGWRNFELEEIRVPVPTKFPPTSVGTLQQSRMVN